MNEGHSIVPCDQEVRLRGKYHCSTMLIFNFFTSNSTETNNLNLPIKLIHSQQLYFGNHSRREMDEDGINLAWCMESAETDVDDVGDVDTDPDKDIDPDSGDANTDSDLNMPELEFTMNGSQNEEEDIEEEDEEEVEEEEEDDIRMDDEDCEDELEPQLKKKKTK